MGFTKITTEVKNISALPDKVNDQASWLKGKFDQAGETIKTAVNGLIDELTSKTAGESIGVDITSVTSKTLQAVLEAFETAIADRYTKTEADTLVSSGINSLVADVDVNLTTGVITVTKKDGTSETFDTALEKVPAKFEIVESGGAYYLKITNVDNTSTQTDITSLMNIYKFSNSDEVAFSTSGTGNEKTITASIRANSIGIDKLSLTAVSTIEGYKNSAADSASAAALSATSAENSATTATEKAEVATASAETATSKASEATASATTATTKASEASASAAEAKAWAEQAQASSQGGDMLKSTYDTNNSGVVDNAEKLGGQLPEYYQKSIVIEASADNVVDFNNLTESGIYLIKFSNAAHVSNAPRSDATPAEIILIVSKMNVNNQLFIYQNVFGAHSSGTPGLAIGRYLMGSTWKAWSDFVNPYQISAGNFYGKMVAKDTAEATLADRQIRNITASTTDLTAGTSALTTGEIYLVFE